MPEFPDMERELLADDAIPETLLPVLKIIASDYLPEIKSLVTFLNDYIDNSEVDAGTLVIADPQQRVLGMISMTIRGQEFTVAARHYSIWMLQRFQDAYDVLEGSAKGEIDALFGETGLAEITALRTTKRIERKGFKEVWG